MAKTSTQIFRRLEAAGKKPPEPKAVDPKARAREQAELAIARLPQHEQIGYLGLLYVDPTDLRRTEAWDAADRMERLGPAGVLNSDGKLIDLDALDFTPQSIGCIVKAATKHQIIKSLTTGADLLQQLQEKPPRRFYPPDYEAAPLRIKHEFINAVAGLFEPGTKARHVIQTLVEQATETGRFEPASWKRESLYSLRHELERGLNYLCKPLTPPANVAAKFDMLCDRPPIVELLAVFLRSLPKGQEFRINATGPAVPQSTVDEAPANGLTSRQQSEADAIKQFLFSGKAAPAKPIPA